MLPWRRSHLSYFLSTQDLPTDSGSAGLPALPVLGNKIRFLILYNINIQYVSININIHLNHLL